MAAGQTQYAQFAYVARILGAQARRLGLSCPGFRSPPRIVGVDRSIRRTENGAIVSVRLRDRPFVAVVSDMIEGVISANLLVGREAELVRGALWIGVDQNIVTDQSQTRVA